MRNILLLAMLLLGGIGGSNWLHAQGSDHSGGIWFQLPEGAGPDDYVPNRIIFKVKDSYRNQCSQNRVEVPAFASCLDALRGLRLTRSFPMAQKPDLERNALGQKLSDLSLIYELDYDAAIDIETAVNILLRSGIMEYAEPSYIYRPMFDPSDPDTAAQYYLNLIHARQAWDISKGDTTIKIGITDTGISFTHPDLVSEIAWNYADPIDGLDNDNNGYVDDFKGWDFGGNFWNSPGDNDPRWWGSASASEHGVLTSGAAAAATDNGNQIASIGFKCKIFPVKVTIDETPLIYRGYQGVVYAADMGCQIINMSWGGSLVSRMGSDAIRYAAINKGAALVAAAGNTPSYINFYPASYPEVLSVAGTQQNDLFWNTTASFGTTYSYFVDACAPSRDIRTTAYDTGLSTVTGTSLGAPIACGIAGLVLADNPGMSNHQALQMVRMGADENIYNLNPGTYAEKMGKGRTDGLGALTYSGPAVRAVDVFFDAGSDGLVQAGDTIDVRVRFANYLAPVTNLQIDLTTPNFATFEILHGQSIAGDVGTMDTVSAWLAPFRIVVRSTVTAGTLGYLRFGYQGNNYTDYEYYGLRVEPSYVNVDAGMLETSMDSRGRWGYVSFPALNTGKGLIIDGVGGMIDDSGFLLGKDNSHVSNNFENQSGGGDNHFSSVIPISRSLDGPLADLHAYTRYSDAGAGANALGVTIDQNTYQYGMEGDDNYIIQEYTITNNGAAALSGLYAGMYFDYEGFWAGNNTSKYDSANKFIYNFFESYASLWNVGITVLTDDTLHGTAVETASFGYTQAEKWNAITADPQTANLNNVDLAQFVSAGPFDIPAGGSHTVAFAIIATDTLHEIPTSRQAAYDKYWCVIRGNMTTQVDLGPDVLQCGSTAPLTLDAGPGFASYEWNDGSSGQTLSATTSGEYWVKVTNGAASCEDYDRIQVTLNEGLTGGFTCNPSGGLFVGDTITFADTTTGAIEWGWDFGDGSQECPLFSQTSHSYAQPGSYIVTMYVGNGVCIDTVTKVLVVDTVVGLQDAQIQSGMLLYPNPGKDNFILELEADWTGVAELAIFDLAGRKTYGLMVEKAGRMLQQAMEVPLLPAGIYLVKAQLGDKVWTATWVRQ